LLSSVPSDFSQRYRYFSLYSTQPGCLLDEEGWFSVTPELVANQIADRCCCDTVLDAFCGVGGSAIAFAMTCQRGMYRVGPLQSSQADDYLVITLDTSPTRLALARHNAQIYGVADRIEFVLSDFLSFAKSYNSLPSLSRHGNTKPLDARKIDVIFLSPPWGGPSYINGFSGVSTPWTDDIIPAPTSDSNHPSYSLSSIQPIHGAELFDLARKITRNVAYYLPRSTRIEEVSALLSDEESRTGSGRTESATPERVEIEEEWMGGKLKVLACYFGGLVRGQEHLF
jgi:trimethylguanosine synthase